MLHMTMYWLGQRSVNSMVGPLGQQADLHPFGANTFRAQRC